MRSELIKTRKINGETYNFILHTPDYFGETGCLAIELQPYIKVITPENCFGYPDYLYYDNTSDKLYTSERYLQPWIKKELLKTYKTLANKYL